MMEENTMELKCKAALATAFTFFVIFILFMASILIFYFTGQILIGNIK